MFVKHVSPPSLNVTVTLIFDLETKFNRGHLQVMTNHHAKLEGPWAMCSLVIDHTRFVNGPTKQSNIPPLLKGGIITVS